MPEQRRHPHLLPWYLSGDLDPDRARETERHLKTCEECRAELHALSSMMQTIERESRAFSAGRPRPEPPAGRPLPPQAAPSRRTTALWALVAATAVIAALPAFFTAWSTTSGPPVRAIRSITFPPPSLGGEGERTLTAPGPWAVRVVAPFGAPRGTYRVRVRRENGTTSPEYETDAPAGDDGILDVILGPLAEPGRYSMVLEPARPTGAARYVYPFEVLPAGGRAPAPPAR